MSDRRYRAAAVVVLVAGVALAACSGASSPSPSRVASSPSPTPIFTSDADALAAATEAYKNFLRLSDEVGHEGGARPERVGEYAGDAVVEAERKQASELAASRARSYGETKVSNSRLQSIDRRGSTVTVSIYACEDLREVDVRDPNGHSLFPPDRPDFVAYVVGVAGKSREDLIVVSHTFWEGGGVCG